MSTWQILHGDVRERLKDLQPSSVQCVVTSPPYWGLRDYGVEGQLGLESTPDAFTAAIVSVFADVWNVVADDGVCWLNLGDSYVNAGGADRRMSLSSTIGRSKGKDRRLLPHAPSASFSLPSRSIGDLKQKDLVGIPWRVAFALQQPRYTGDIKREADRIWLAAAIDAEGCIFIHKRKVGQSNGQGYERQNDSFGSGLEVANTSELFVRRCLEITGRGSICHQDGHGRKQRLYRWNLRSNECRYVLREVYPYLVAKQQQARLAIGCPSSGSRAEAAHAALIGLHRGFGSDVDFKAPESLYTPGWYLRSDVIWSKLNPMPESVTDRPTKAHEYVFLLTKSAKYFYNAAAIREPYAPSTLQQFDVPYDGEGIKGYEAAGVQNPSDLKRRIVDKQRQHGNRRYVGFNNRWDASVENKKNYAAANIPGQSPHGYTQREDGLTSMAPNGGANKRSVWTIPTSPYPDAHFATFPEALVEPCILAGSKEGDLIFDPFCGSGTTLAVAIRLGRNAVGIELNESYCELARKRVSAVAPLFASGHVVRHDVAAHVQADAPASVATDPAVQDSLLNRSTCPDLCDATTGLPVRDHE